MAQHPVYEHNIIGDIGVSLSELRPLYVHSCMYAWQTASPMIYMYLHMYNVQYIIP